MSDEQEEVRPLTPVLAELAPSPLPAGRGEGTEGGAPRLAKLLSALWFGAGAFILIAAAAIFRAAESPTIAANVVGAMLTRWHYLALLIPVALVFVLRNRARSIVMAALFTAIILASVQAFVDLRIRQIRASTPIAISALDRDDPLRRQFGMLHGLSSLLLVVQVLAAAAVVSETT
ncbi:MAG TPA: hypothetical protein VN605_04860 [Thermoanaerobaculia bacterium]|nr:hypothetical protein [Thermoanaerobaculia bacterium]